MPMYVFTNPETGESVERFYPISEFRREIRVKGKVFHLDVGAQQNGVPITPGNWPRWSDALGVNPSQKEEVEQFYREQGISTEVNREGQIRIDSPSHQRRILKAEGMVDFSSYI